LFLEKTLSESETLVSGADSDVAVVATQTMIVEGAKKSVLKKLRDDFGMEVVREGAFGKVLLRSQEGGRKGVERAFEAARKCFESGNVEA
jgi:hypothetical protein